MYITYYILHTIYITYYILHTINITVRELNPNKNFF